MKSNLVLHCSSRTLCLLLLLSLCFRPARAQLKGTVKDSESGAPVSYANIQVLDKNAGTSADEQGHFTLTDTDTPAVLVVSATGYESLQAVYRSDLIITLHKAPVQLQEVVIDNNRKGSILKIGTYKKSQVRVKFGTNHAPWILARYFPYSPAYKRTPFLKSVMIQTSSSVKDAVFNLKLYRKDENGLPGAFLCSENIIVHAKKGKQNTIADLSPYNIIFPEEGLFIGVEFLFVEQNRYVIDVFDEAEKRSYKETHYAPRIGALPVENEGEAFIFSEESGIWNSEKPTLFCRKPTRANSTSLLWSLLCRTKSWVHNIKMPEENFGHFYVIPYSVAAICGVPLRPFVYAPGNPGTGLR